MNSLIVLLSVLAVANGQGCANVFDKKCFEQTLEFKQCIISETQNITKANLQEIKEFAQAVSQCFNQDGIKGICIPPSPSAAPPPPSPSNPSGPPAEFGDCFNGSKQAFSSCFRQALNISADCQPPADYNAPANTGPLGQPHNFHRYFFHINPAEVKKNLSNMCGGNESAATQLQTCALQAAKPYMKALVGVLFPLITLCQAQNVCSIQCPISSDCQAKLQTGIKAYCQCMPVAKKFIQQNDQCASFRAAHSNSTESSESAEDKAEEQGNEVSAGHQNMPHHPQRPFNFCKHPNICQELHDKFEKLHAAYSKGAGQTSS